MVKDVYNYRIPDREDIGASALKPQETNLGVLGSTYAVNWADTVYVGTVGEDLELTLGEDWPAAGNSAAIDMVLDNSAEHAITWTLIDYWIGTAPSGAGVYVITIWSTAGTIYGAGVVRGDGT